MTFRRKTIVLGSIAAALLISFILGGIFSPERRLSSAAERRLFPGFTAEKAMKIELSGQESKVTLVKSSTWTISIDGVPYPAADSKISILLQELASLSAGKLVTRNEGNTSTFGFGQADEVRLAVYGSNGEILCGLSAGKTEAAGRGKYIRAGTSPEIFETAESLSPYLSADNRFWQNLKVFPKDLKAADISGLKVVGRLSLSGGKDTGSLGYELSRSTDPTGVETWSVAGQNGPALDAQKVKNLLDALIAFEGNDMDGSQQSLQQIRSGSKAVITLRTSDSRAFVLDIGDRLSGDQYPCALRDGAYSYRVPEWRVSQAFVTKESLIPQDR
jgi:hypothetical protein